MPLSEAKGDDSQKVTRLYLPHVLSVGNLHAESIVQDSVVGNAVQILIHHPTTKSPLLFKIICTNKFDSMFFRRKKSDNQIRCLLLSGFVHR